MASQRSKQVEVKLGIDGDMTRLRVACKGHLATKSFPKWETALEWLNEEFDALYRAMRKELEDGPTR